jgi:hypothetical protein
MTSDDGMFFEVKRKIGREYWRKPGRSIQTFAQKRRTKLKLPTPRFGCQELMLCYNPKVLTHEKAVYSIRESGDSK